MGKASLAGLGCSSQLVDALRRSPVTGSSALDGIPFPFPGSPAFPGPSARSPARPFTSPTSHTLRHRPNTFGFQEGTPFGLQRICTSNAQPPHGVRRIRTRACRVAHGWRGVSRSQPPWQYRSPHGVAQLVEMLPPIRVPARTDKWPTRSTALVRVPFDWMPGALHGLIRCAARIAQRSPETDAAHLRPWPVPCPQRGRSPCGMSMRREVSS